MKGVYYITNMSSPYILFLSEDGCINYMRIKLQYVTGHSLRGQLLLLRLRA